MYCSIVAFGVLIVNFVSMIWAIAKDRLDTGYGVLYDGNCGKAQDISTALHVLINILSTILLSASNYTMQCLHSPTRRQVDLAHAQNKWLDIGIPSWRNRKHVSIKNRILWVLLALSSVPLHFIYNSGVFLDIASQEYHAAFTNSTMSQLLPNNKRLKNGSAYVEMALQDCANIYNRRFAFDHGNVILTSPDRFNGDANSRIGASWLNWTTPVSKTYDSNYFPLQSHPIWNLSTALPHHRVSLVGSLAAYHNVTSCYSDTAVAHCKIKLNILIVAIVVACNLVKAICMLVTVWKSNDYPLVTIGDAVASFLEYPDISTQSLCLLSKTNIDKIWGKLARPMKCKFAAEKAMYSVSPRRWANINLLFFIALIILILGTITGLLPNKSAFSTGIGFSSSLDKYPTILSTGLAVPGFWGNFRTIILVNAPQVAVSLMNVLYNGLFTGMMLTGEWNSFSQRRQPLRVTTPRGEQRSNYYLSIPYLYAVPLLVLTSTFHWLISESFFLVSITAYKGLEIRPEDSVLGIGYSALSILLASVVCLTLIALLTFKSVQKCKVGMPVGASCSTVISAACHKPKEEQSPELRRVMWGVVKGPEESLGSWKNGGNFGHCTFSSGLVGPPVSGRLHA